MSCVVCIIAAKNASPQRTSMVRPRSGPHAAEPAAGGEGRAGAERGDLASRRLIPASIPASIPGLTRTWQIFALANSGLFSENKIQNYTEQTDALTQRSNGAKLRTRESCYTRRNDRRLPEAGPAASIPRILTRRLPALRSRIGSSGTRSRADARSS